MIGQLSNIGYFGQFWNEAAARTHATIGSTACLRLAAEQIKVPKIITSEKRETMTNDINTVFVSSI